MQEWIVPAVLGALTLVSLVLAVVLLRSRSTTAGELRSARAEAASLRAQMDDIERRLAARQTPTPRPQAEYVITRLGEDGDGPAPHVEPTLFADLVMRETVVRAAALAHGVRRALAPEVRNRIRFEMRREVRASRKRRLRERRDLGRRARAAERAALADEDAA
jgi:hypothetical protein